MKYNVAVLYGSRSPEHEISIITALQAMNALKEAGHQVIPIYITKEGQWLKGDKRFLKPNFYRNLNQPTAMGKSQLLLPGTPNPLFTKRFFGSKPQPIDIIFPIFHGLNGEDGSIQGMVQLLNLPIAGSNLTPATIGIDKFLTKQLASSLGIPTIPHVLVTPQNFKLLLPEINKLGHELIIKPNRLGSSIGIGVAHTQEEFDNALEVAFSYDSRVLIEPYLKNISEVNIAIMGNDPYEFSATEMPLRHDEVLSFQDKYERGGKKTGAKTGGAKGMASGDRHIPAPISAIQERQLKEYAETLFRALQGRGMARLDFILQGDKIYFNEINTIPGALAFFLWDKVGLSFPQLVDKLVNLGIEAHRDEQKLIHTFDSNLLSSMN